MKVRPGNIDVVGNRALILQRLGKLEAALAAYDEVLQARPDDVQTHYNRATAAHLPRAAVASTMACVASSEDLVLGGLLGFSGRPLAAYDEVLRARPDDAQTHYNRATAAHLLGRPEEALSAYDRALRIKPNYREAMTGRGLVLAELGRAEEALRIFWRARRCGSIRGTRPRITTGPISCAGSAATRRRSRPMARPCGCARTMRTPYAAAPSS